DLLLGNRQCAFQIAGLDELRKFRRAGDVCALADDDEVGSWGAVPSGARDLLQARRGSLAVSAARDDERSHSQRLETAEAHVSIDGRWLPRRQIAHRSGDRSNVIGSGAAAAANDVQP